MTTDNFLFYSKYYNLLYKDKDYSSEVDYVAKLLKLYVPKVKTVLEFGSGTGAHGILLQNRGFDVYGIERSRGMVEEAQLNGLNCKLGDITNFSLFRKFDTVISLFHVISYLTENKSLIATFKNANLHLNDGGVFLFDTWYSPAVSNLKPLPRIKKMGNEQLEVTRIAEPVVDYNKNIVNVNFTVIAKELSSGKITELQEIHPMRHFSIPEIELLAALTGFELSKSEEFLTGKEPSENSWGVCFILKKIADVSAS